MQYNVDTIRERSSVRTYSEKKIEPGKVQQLVDYIKENSVGPFGSVVRMIVTDIEGTTKKQMKEYKTYGIIKGTTTYIIGALKKNAFFEDFGYVFEKVILKATEMGLGTCWLGGTFKRSGFAESIGLEDDEILCAISPLGYAASKRRFAENTIRSFAGSAKRLPFESRFFDSPHMAPMNREEAGIAGEILEYVRIGPSASNKQPWRVIKAGDLYHFYLARTPGYQRNAEALGGADLQRSDIGIAMCHFELAAGELDPNFSRGKWENDDPGIRCGFTYIATWKS